MRIYLSILLYLVFTLAKGQNFAPISNGLYSGVHAAKINPAFTAYSKYKWHVNVIGAWANVNNNYLQLRLPYSAYRLINNDIPNQYKTENGNAKWDSSYLKEKLNGRPKHFAAGAMLYLPSFTLSLKNNWHIGLLTDATALARVSGLSENLAHALYKELDTAKNAYSQFNNKPGQSNTIHRMTISGNAYASLGINISKDIPLEWKQHLLVGATLKKVWGLGGAFFQNGDMVAKNIRSDSVTLNRTNIRYGQYTGIGKGMGVDIGIGWVYHKPEYRQPGDYSRKHTNYLYKFGLGILDIGSIKYKNASITSIINNRLTEWNTTNIQDRFSAVTPGYPLVDTILNALPNLRQTTQDLRIGLPTRLALSADYQVMPDIYVNMQVVQSLRGRYSIHARQQYYVSVAPRWESDFFEVSIPLYLEYDYRAFRMGAAFRVGPLYFGSNSVMSMLYTKRLRDADFFIGIAFGDIPGNWKDRWLKKHGKKPGIADPKDCEKM